MIDHQGLRLPDFIGIGPGRTGTTWLHDALKNHLGLPRRYKEVRFFNRFFDRGLEWYSSHFAEFPREMKVGEITPGYFQSTVATSRIAETIPDCKIICTLREPIARMYSLYRLFCFQGQINEPFERALEKYPITTVRVNLNADHLNRWLHTFGQARVLVCLYDDLETDPRKYLDRVTDFIGAPRISLANSIPATQRVLPMPLMPLRPRAAFVMWRVQRFLERDLDLRIRRILIRAGVWQFCFRPGAPFPPLDPALVANLRRKFLSDNEALERLIGRDLSAWK
jgi:hypothetical protein